MHLKLRILISSVFLFHSLLFFAQATDNTAIYRNIKSKSYIRLHYDNDFFASTDQYYTQGINLEVISSKLKFNPLTRILLKTKNSSLQYGLALVHEGYTPSSIRHEEIILNDRPFAAVFCLNTFVISTDTVKHKRITSSITLGIIGPLAGGADMQKSIHRW